MAVGTTPSARRVDTREWAAVITVGLLGDAAGAMIVLIALPLTGIGYNLTVLENVLLGLLPGPRHGAQPKGATTAN